MRLIDSESGVTLAERVEVADSFWSRLRGLMFRRGFAEGEALLFKFSRPRRFGVHTFFVFFPIDLVYLDRGFSVLEVKRDLSPWSTYRPGVRADLLVELPGGTIERAGVEVGDELELLEEGA